MRINLRPDGTIDAIGYMPYNYLCPSFIDTMNFTNYRCVNEDRIADEESWVLISSNTEGEIAE
jgi:hypothetical protein